MFLMQIRHALLLAFLLYTASLAAQIRTPAPSPAATVSQVVGLSKITIEYSRPSVKGRKIFGDLVPYDKVWRTGANRITTVQFEKDMSVNGQKIAAGTYGLYTFPGPKSWVLAFNSDSKQWGAYEYDDKKDVLRLSVKSEKTAKPVEHFNIAFDNFTPTATDVVLSWEKTAVRFRAQHDPHEQIMAAIRTETAKPDAKADTYYSAAEYYLEKNIDLPQALAWANKVLETDKNWWSYYLRAEAASRLNQCGQAEADAKVAMEGATKDKDTAYIKKINAVLTACGKK